mgnify:CR=1 FL=1
MDLKPYRDQINEIDQEIIRQLARRKELSRKIGELKSLHQAEVHDLKREAELKALRAELAEALGLDPQEIEPIFQAILSWSHKLQS